MSSFAEPDAEMDGERVIDRSGDIDQRPPGERTGPEAASVIAFKPPARRIGGPAPSVQHYAVPAPAPQRSQPPHPGLAEMAQRLQNGLDKQYAKGKSQLEALAQKIEAQEKRCQMPKLGSDLQQIRFQRQKILIANGPMLADSLREEKSRLEDLQTFKMENCLTRDAQYPSSPVLAFGILSILVLVEAGINGVLFADSSDQGLFGGWLEALVLAITNAGAAFLLGRIAFPQLHGRSFSGKAAGAVISLAGVAALIAVNLAGAHYRDFKSSSPGAAPPPPAAVKHEPAALAGVRKGPLAAPPAHIAAKPAVAEPPAPQPVPQPADKEKARELEAIARALANPFNFQSFMSVFLFVIGLCAAAVAALDGYKLDDPFPGYGKRHRQYAAARAESGEMLRRILSQSNAIMTGNFHEIGRKIESFAQEVSELLALHYAYAATRKELQGILEQAAREAEDDLSAHERFIAKVPDRDAREILAFSVKQLPELSEKHVKFFETQEKKLKALQKDASKEQGDVLGVFEAASADFQKLLADASQASLRAAFIMLTR
jgi:hypothetical protein